MAAARVDRAGMTIDPAPFAPLRFFSGGGRVSGSSSNSASEVGAGRFLGEELPVGRLRLGVLERGGLGGIRWIQRRSAVGGKAMKCKTTNKI